MGTIFSSLQVNKENIKKWGRHLQTTLNSQIGMMKKMNADGAIVTGNSIPMVMESHPHEREGKAN